MGTKRLTTSLFALVVLVALTLAQGTQADYDRAANLRALTANKVFKARIQPTWFDGNNKFWYRNDLSGGKREFVLVDCAKGVRTAAFDHRKMAAALAKATGAEAEADRLPIDNLVFEAGKVKVAVKGKTYEVDLKSYAAKELPGEETVVPSLPNLGLPRPSGPNGEESEIVFVNRLNRPVKLFWIGSDMSRSPYGEIAAGARHAQHTFENHVWLVTDAEGRVIGVYQAQAKPGTAIIEGRAGQIPRGQRGQRGPGGQRQGPPPGQSPDGKWMAFFKENNLWLRNVATSSETQLSKDGTEADRYRGEIAWSPDSKKVAVFRVEGVEQRKVHMVESTPRDQLQPKLLTIDYTKPGDKLEQKRPQLFHVESVKHVPVPTDLIPDAYDSYGLRWAPDSSEFTFVYNQRGHQVLRVVAVDGQTGQARAMVDEQSKTFIHYSGKMYLEFVDSTNELIWMSERDGWNHLYLLDQKTGKVKNQITKGQWVVQAVQRFDPAKRQIYFTAGGLDPKQDPYHTHYCRINLDGTGLVDLTPGDGTHRIEASPDGRYIIDQYSRVDLPPVHELRRWDDGKLVCKLEEADVSELLATGWRMPERFVAKGRDGKTDIFGIIIRPPSWDPKKKYPVLEAIYAGPHGFHVPKAWGTFTGQMEWGELGFVVVQIDGMGTSGRSKAFHDVCWRNLKDAGFPDRILWMKAAAAKDPSLDITRVGIYGGSAGGQNAMGALLFHGDFYKAAVADCGCHDNRMDKIWWNEQWMGYPIGPWYAESSNAVNAHMLTGKLMLILGELDTNVDPASTMQVIDALNKAGKDYEFLFVPGGGHCPGGSPYGIRRQRDFFIRSLWGVEPRR